MQKIQSGGSKVWAHDVHKALRVYPEIGNLIGIGTDLGDTDENDQFLTITGEDELRSHVARLAADLIEEREHNGQNDIDREAQLQPHDGSLYVGNNTAGSVQCVKNHLKIQCEVITSLWDEQRNVLETSPGRVSQLLKNGAIGRQGRDRGDGSQGQCFLDQWSCRLHACRTSLCDTEMA